jgi:hypothetical protein
MHEPIKEGLEDFLRGSADVDFLAHLDACRECREEVGRLSDQAALVRLLRAEEDLAPAPGFYARVMARVESQSRPGLWSLLLEPAFGRKLMYVSASLVVLLGTYLFTTEAGDRTVVSSPAEQYLAEEHPAVGANPQQDRDLVLVRLATYNE